MHKSFSKFERSERSSIDKSNIGLPKYPHSVIICGQTGCEKKEFVLYLLESEYDGIFEKKNSHTLLHNNLEQDIQKQEFDWRCAPRKR